MQDAIDATEAGLTALDAAIYTPGTGLLARSDAMFATLNTPTTGVLARLTTVENKQTSDNSAAINRINALEATVNTPTTGLVARMGVQETATANLQTGKADVSRVTALEAKVDTPGTGLLARMASQETATVNLQAQKADASRVALLEARADTLAYGDIFAAYIFRNDALNGWTVGGQTASLTAGPSFATLTALTGDPQFLRTGLAIQGSRFTRVVVDIERTANRTTGGWQGKMYWATSGHSYSDTYSISGVPDVLLGERRELVFDIDTSLNVQNAADWKASTITALRLDFDNGNSGQFRIYSIRVLGPDGARLAASVSTLESAVANLQTGKADASRVTSLEATVNTPGTGLTARLTTVESVAASANGTAKAIKGVVLDVNGYVSGFASTNDGTTSQFEILASVFGIRDPSAGERAEYRAGSWYVYSPSESTRTRYGKAFGGTQKLVWWTGPSSVAEGSETKANAYVYMSQNTVSGPRFGGSDIVGGSGVLTATASSLIVQGGRNGAGGVSTSTTTVTAAGGNSGASIRWVKVSGDDLVANSPSSFTTSFYGTVGTGQSKSAVFMGVVTKAGQQAAVYVQADIADNGT